MMRRSSSGSHASASCDVEKFVEEWSRFRKVLGAEADLGGVLNSVCEAVVRLFHGCGHRLRRTTDAVGKSMVKHLTLAAA